ncbi:unnamed protein product [Thelazia callipaeda]|uniref:ZP domain-containing protein n=1 Tax=Thelazia callipaeda TaxID=103827 RepID=A0A0N5CVK0_THECL|nr:unnamed protein product [Thelazia callipaeda]
MLLLIPAFLLHLLQIQEAKTFIRYITEVPEVTCGPQQITVRGKTDEPFEGVVFVKNWRRTELCSASYYLSQNTTEPSFSIPLNRIEQCGLVLRRNSDSKELEIFVVIVFSFHPNFVTGGDRSFAVHCIFQQQTFKVATKFNFIADISTRGIIGATAQLPYVSLQIVEGRVPDPKLKSATIVSVGDPLMFIWHLNSSTGIYGVVVKECYVESEDGRKIKIIDHGCSMDPLIVSHVQYSENNIKAFADGSAFKFPDAEEVWVSCAVAACLQKFDQFTDTDSDHICDKQPSCSKRDKRSSNKQVEESAEIYLNDDMVHHRLRVIDQPTHTIPYRDTEKKLLDDSDEICMEKNFFAGTYAALATVYLAAISLAGGFGLSVYRSQSKN